MKRVLATVALACLAASAVAGPTGYKVTGRIDVPGPTHWSPMAYSAKLHRLYIPQSPVTTVLDVDTKKVVGTIENTPMAHHVEIAPDLNLGFSVVGHDAKITVFALDTLKTTATIKVGRNPQMALYDPASKRLMSLNETTRDVSFVDVPNQKIAGRVALEGPPGMAVMGTKGRVFLNVMFDNTLVVMDPIKARQLSRTKLPDCRSPFGLAVDPQGRLYSACRNGRLVVSSPDGKPIAKIVLSNERMAQGIDGAVFQDGHLFIPNGRDSNIVVVDETKPGRWEVVEVIPTERGARTLVGDPENHRLFTVTADVDPASTNERPKAVPESLHVLVIERS